MVLDNLSGKERKGLVAAFAVAITASLAAGYMGAGMTAQPTGAFTADSVSKADTKNTVQSIMDQQTQRQEQQLALMAQQNEQLSEEDLSINANVESVEESQFPSLYKVTVSVTGETPSRQNPGETQTLDEQQVMYISKDGRYLFRQPTDLQQQPQQPAPTGP